MATMRYDVERRHSKRGTCSWCGGPVLPPKRHWCSQACVDEYLVRKSATNARDQVRARDHGVCAICGWDTSLWDTFRYWFHAAVAELEDVGGPRWILLVEFLQRPLTRHDLLRRELWDVDHINPVADGGGQCGLDGLRTLCIPCHRSVTAQQARTRMAKNKTAKTNGSNGDNPHATLTKLELDARTADLVTQLRSLEAAEHDKRVSAGQHRKKIRELKEKVDELREEVGTGMLSPARRQVEMPLAERANGEPEPQGDGTVLTNPAQAKRKRASRKKAEAQPDDDFPF